MKGFSLCLLPFHKLKWIVSLPTRRRQEVSGRERKKSKLGSKLRKFSSTLTLVLICLSLAHTNHLFSSVLVCTFRPEVSLVERVPSDSNERLYDVRYHQWSPSWLPRSSWPHLTLCPLSSCSLLFSSTGNVAHMSRWCYASSYGWGISWWKLLRSIISISHI